MAKSNGEPSASVSVSTGPQLPNALEVERQYRTLYHAGRGALCVKARVNQDLRLTRHEQGWKANSVNGR